MSKNELKGEQLEVPIGVSLLVVYATVLLPIAQTVARLENVLI